MKITKKAKAGLFRDYSRIVSSAHVKNLKSLGLDIIEARREGPYVHDTEGNRYLDCNTAGSIFNLGRRHPEVVSELSRAMHGTDQGNFPMISREKAALAKSLAAFVPGELDCSVFSVVRGEAFDFACKLARGFTERGELIALDGSWFGQTGFALSLSERADKEDFAPLVPEVRILSHGDPAAAQGLITKKTAAVVLEPVQAENHCRVPDGDWLRALRRICRRAGALLIFDETQTGLGRTGRRFAFEHFDVLPDVLIMGEALGAGLFPIAATLFTQRINRFLNRHPLIHLSTFGGSDLGCVVARKALEVYEGTRPWENASRLGSRLRSGIERIIESHGSVIRSVAGMGLLLSIDLKTPAKARSFCKKMAGAGVLASPGEVAKHTVVLRPGLTITQRGVDQILKGVSVAAKARS